MNATEWSIQKEGWEMPMDLGKSITDLTNFHYFVNNEKTFLNKGKSEHVTDRRNTM